MEEKMRDNWDKADSIPQVGWWPADRFGRADTIDPQTKRAAFYDRP